MWYKLKYLEVELSIYVKPNAKKTALVAFNHNQGLIIALHAPPREGEANVELIRFLAKLLGIPKSHISIKSGEHSRMKKILLPLNTTVQKILEEPEGFI